MAEPQERTPGTDDTAAFLRFYEARPAEDRRGGLLYRLLVGWWRDRP